MLPDTRTNYLDRMSFTRRHFLKIGSLAGALAAGERIPTAAPWTPTEPRHDLDTVSCAVIGFGDWGREIAAALDRLEEARLTAIVDHFPIMLRRAQRAHPDAARHADYRAVLNDPGIQAVFIATPTHTHKQIVIHALEAGKHVYCEAPLAHTIDDSRAIARAARAAKGQIFQGGLLYRTEPQYRSVYGFIRSGAIGQPAMGRSQWHMKDSWRRVSASREREQELNWRLDADLSLGLFGEVGIQQIDTTAWMLGGRASSVTGFGAVMFWKDGRNVADTVQALISWPNDLTTMYDASLVSGFDAMYDLLFGSDATIILRDNKAWMFKEVDAPMLGWEVYARKDKFYKETGIALLANATKLDALGEDPTAEDPNAETPLYWALKAFMDNYNYGPFDPVVNFERAHEATVVAIKGAEAIRRNTRVDITDEDYAV